MFRGLTVRDNIVMQAVKGEETRAIERATEAFPILGERLHQRAGTMSGGQQQMLAMAAAYVRDPKLVLVDEASLGLAPTVVDEIFAFLERRTREGASLLIVDQFVPPGAADGLDRLRAQPWQHRLRGGGRRPAQFEPLRAVPGPRHSLTARVLAGRVALVTGAGRGIGRAHALELAAAGAYVVVNDVGAALDGRGHDSAPAAEVVEEIEAIGGRSLPDRTDIASIAGGSQAVRATIEAFGRIDILVNNAGFAHGGGDIEGPVEVELDELLAVHYKGPVGTMSAAFADMRRRGWGRIINTVSEAALDLRFAGGLGYGAAKAALWSATLSAALAGAAHGITVNGVSPGARTRMNAGLLDAGFRDGTSARLDLDPAHVARVVAYLASDEAGDITGRIIHAAGGLVREYTTTRTSRSELVDRLDAALGTSVTVRH